MVKMLDGHRRVQGGHILGGHGNSGTVALVNLVTQFSASDWTPVGANTVTDDGDGSVLITGVDNFTGATITDLNNILSVTLTSGSSYRVVFNAKKTGLTKAVWVNGPTYSVNVTASAYTEYEITFVAGGGTNYFQARQFNAADTFNIKDMALYAL